MRIISKFHDYYDCLQDGSDPNVWVRKQEEVRYSTYMYRNLSSELEKHFLEIDFGCIAFCGQLYKLIWASCPASTKVRTSTGFERTVPTVKRNYYYSWEAFQKTWSEQVWKFYEDKKDRWDAPGRTLRNLEVNFKTYTDLRRQSWNKLFTEHNAPCFYVDDYEMIVNPSLKDYQFYKVFNVQQTFQEIEMYVFGVLGAGSDHHKPKYKGSPVAARMSNDDMITSHGFDLKSSFRKEKQRKR